MLDNKLEVTYRKTSDLIPYARNARTHSDEQVGQIAASIKEFGFNAPIAVDNDDGIIYGHGRILAAKKLKMETVPTVCLGHLNKHQKMAYIIADNQLALNAGWDEDLLATDILELSANDFDIDMLGFQQDWVDDIIDQVQSPIDLGDLDEKQAEPADDVDDEKLDEIPQDVEPICKTGDTHKVGNATLYVGDCAEILMGMAANTVDSLVVDPPAGISFMSKKWDDDKGGRDHWIEWMSGIMSECLRVLKPGGHGLVWAIPRTSHWTATALENSGFEVRDVVTHLFGSGFPKSLNVSKAIDKMEGVPDSKKWQGYGTNLKPASEHWILVRKPLGENTVAENVLKWGVGGINIDGCRVGSEHKEIRLSKGKNIYGGNSLLESNTSQTTSRDGCPQGRFPANLILSHHGDCTRDGFKEVKGDWSNKGKTSADIKSVPGAGIDMEVKKYSSEDGTETVENWNCHPDCAVSMLDKQSGSSPSNFRENSTSERNTSKTDSGWDLWDRSTKLHDDKGGASRFFYVAKASRSERNAGCEGLPLVKLKDHVGKRKLVAQAESSKNPNLPRQNYHPTVKPVKLMEYFVTMVTPQGGTVLDCFNGSGTTGLAALRKCYNYIGIERELEYADISLARWQGFTGIKLETI